MDELDKGPADGVGLDEGPVVRTDNSAGLAEGLAESEERRPEVEARQAELDEGAGGRQRGRQGTRPGTQQAGRRRGRQAGNAGAGQETRQVGDNAGRQVTRWLCSQAGTLPGRKGGR